MKIWHPETTCLAGGPKTFVKYFDEYFEKELVIDYMDADIIFGLNNWVPLSTIQYAKTRGKKYVHRANGVYRDILLNIPDWKERNEEIKPHYLEADHVVFQSVFSRQGYFEYIAPTEQYTIIYNGVDTNKYTPELLDRTNCDDREGIILLGKDLTQKESKIKDTVGLYTRYIPKGLNKYETFDDFILQLHNKYVAIDSDIQANCNNLELELMALGIPIICLAEGGNPELCLPELISDGTMDSLHDKTDNVFENQAFFSKRARAHVVSHFSIKDCMEKYRKVFEEVLK